MSLADSLLANSSGNGVSTRTAAGVEERHIVIGTNRFINVPEELRRIGVERDHNVETVTFDCPRYWDEHDLMTMAVYINYICANGAVGSYCATNLRADDSDDSMFHFDWVVSNNVTQTNGSITFLVCAKRTDENQEIDIYWNSERNSEMYVSAGLETVEAVFKLEPDLLTHVLLLADKIASIGGGGGGTGEPGINGVTFTPFVSPSGVLSWTNNGGLANPNPVNLKGVGISSVVVTDGLNGDNVVTVTLTDGTGTMFTVKNGKNGAPGVTFTPSVSGDGILSWTNDGGHANPPSVNIKGDDYVLTESDKQRIATIALENIGDVGVSFDGGYVDDNGYLHFTKDGSELEGYEPIFVGGTSSGGGYTYHMTYGTATLPNGEESENVLTLWEVDPETEQETVKSQFVIAGGGGGTSATNLVVERITPSPLILTPTDKAEIRFRYSSVDSDGETVDGTYTLKRGSTPVTQGICVHGENVIDISDQVGIGTHKFTLTVTDDGGSTAVKTWTVQIVDLRIESVFTDDRKYPAGEPVSFTYIPYGAVQKTVHFILNGEELPSVETSASGVTQAYTLPAQTHGAHLLEVYITAEINSTTVTTDHIYRDIVWFDDTSDVPVISCVLRADHYGKIDTRQYAVNEITYRVFDPATATPTVKHIADGVEVSEETLEGSTNTWYYRTDIIGDHRLTIKCGDTEVSVQLDVAALGIDVTPVTSNLAFDFNPVGRNNASADRLWQDSVTGVKMQVSDNFNWQTGGYQTDDAGEQCFIIKAGTTATINYSLFAADASTDGATFKCVFRVRNVRKADAMFLSCAAGSTKVGLEMCAHAAYLHTSATGSAPLYIPYAEERTVEFEYVINPLTGEKSYILSYEDGVGLRPLVYDDGHRLYQYTAESVPITIGSADCDVYIYRMKAYTAALNDAEMLKNYIADSRC